MNNSQIRYEIFLKVAELENITLAAEALSYTQSGVSHAIAAMEREAGCTLFHRSKAGVSLTENGKKLLPLVQELVNKQHSLDQAMDALSNRVAGTLRVGSFTSFTAIWMAKIIREFTGQFPEVKIELINGTYRDIEEGITTGRLDCGFLSSVENDPLDFTPLFDDPMLVIASPEHEIAQRLELGENALGGAALDGDGLGGAALPSNGPDGDALDEGALPSNGLPLKELRRYPLISQFQGSDHDVQQIFKKARIRPKMKYVLDDDISVMGLVSQNEGIALMPEMMLRTAGFDLVAIPLDPPQHRTIGLATLPIKETTLLVRTFVAFCRGLKEWS